MSWLIVNFTDNPLGLELYIGSGNHIADWVTRPLFVVYLTFGMFLNILLIYYLIRSGKWRSPTFTIITSLAVADMISCASVAMWAAGLFPVLVLPPEIHLLCGIVMFTGLMTLAVSSHHLLFFACLRYYQLTKPLAARARVTRIFVLKGCAIVWFLNAVYMIPFGVLYKPKQVWLNGKEATICDLNGNYFFTNLSYFICFSFIPSVSIAILHAVKYFVVAKAQDAVATQQERRNTDARAVSIVVIIFIVTWIPVNVYSVVKGGIYGEFHIWQDRAYLIAVWIVGSNSAINPLVYCIAAKSIRDDIITVLCGRSESR